MSLSDKTFPSQNMTINTNLTVDDVKEAIKELKGRFKIDYWTIAEREKVNSYIDKIFGDKLI